MFNINVGIDYVLPPPPRSADIPAVASVMPYRGPRRNKDKKREDSKNRKKQVFKQIIEKEAEEDFGRMGCFFESRV